jgi:hypothetical protein
MANTWTDIKTKMQRQARTSNADVLAQLAQDWNTGYHLFNDSLARYYTRQQQFTDLVQGQYIYQTPIDCVRILLMTAQVTPTYEPPVNEVKSEEEWRRIVSVKTVSSSYITDYIMLGNSSFAVFPVPSQNLANGIRFVYQPQDHDLAFDDVTSVTSGKTVTVTNGSTTVTASGSAFNTDMAGWWFQLNGVTDNTRYEIESATTTTLTLKSAFVGTSGSGLGFRVGQLSIIPQAYADAPMHYALGLYFAAEGNDTRAQVHLGSEKNPGLYYQMLSKCQAEYSSANESSIITDDSDRTVNAWFIPYIQS